MEELELIIKIKAETNELKKQALIENLLMESLDSIHEITNRFVSKENLIEDLNQEAYIEFVESINSFDSSKGASFKSFFKRKIESRLKKYVEEVKKESTLPLELTKILNSILDAEEALKTSLKRNPTEAEVASKLMMSISDLKRYKSYASQILSVDIANLMGKKEVMLSEIIKYANTLNDDDENEKKPEISEDLELILESLKPTEREIFIKHLGLMGDSPKSIEELALEYKVSKEKIRSIIDYAKRTVKYQMED